MWLWVNAFKDWHQGKVCFGNISMYILLINLISGIHDADGCCNKCEQWSDCLQINQWEYQSMAGEYFSQMRRANTTMTSIVGGDDWQEQLTNPDPQVNTSPINVDLKHMYTHIYLLGLLVTYPTWSPYLWQASGWIVIGAFIMTHTGCRLCFHNF